MAVQVKNEVLKAVYFLKGLDDAELTQLGKICNEHSYATGDICQTEGQPANRINLIIKGRVGVVMHIPNITYCSSEIIMDSFRDGEVFGWSALLQGAPWSTLRVLEPTEVLYINIDDILGLCDNCSHIGYVLMKNLSLLIASRFRRNRMSILNAIVAIRGE